MTDSSPFAVRAVIEANECEAQVIGTPDERRRILRKYKRLRAEVQQIFTDAESWNEFARKPDEEPIDPDPFGELKRLLSAIDELLANDKGIGPIAAMNFTRSH